MFFPRFAFVFTFLHLIEIFIYTFFFCYFLHSRGASFLKLISSEGHNEEKEKGLPWYYGTTILQSSDSMTFHPTNIKSNFRKRNFLKLTDFSISLCSFQNSHGLHKNCYKVAICFNICK